MPTTTPCRCTVCGAHLFTDCDDGEQPRIEGTCSLPCHTTLRHRAAELDAYLAEIGAHVIQVVDLGAAMEALHHGAFTIQAETADALGFNGVALLRHPHRQSDTGHAVLTAHLARRALGTTSED